MSASGVKVDLLQRTVGEVDELLPYRLAYESLDTGKELVLLENLNEKQLQEIAPLEQLLDWRRKVLEVQLGAQVELFEVLRLLQEENFDLPNLV